jgi:DNA helicase-2/ATP-dependent DNA helicase PcrA
VPGQLLEDLGSPGGRRRAFDGDSGRQPSRAGVSAPHGSPHYAYEDENQSEDQSVLYDGQRKQKVAYSGPAYNSIENIAEFFASRGKKFKVPQMPAPEPAGKKGFRPGQKVRHPKYGEGTVYQREGEGEDAKITVQFPRFGLKKLVEKYAQLERA